MIGGMREVECMHEETDRQTQREKQLITERQIGGHEMTNREI